MSGDTPQNVEAESAVLGAMLKSNKAIVRVRPILEHEHFYRESYGVIFKQIVEMYEEGVPVAPLSVIAALDRTQRLVQADGEVRVQELLTLAATTPSQTEHYAKIVRDCWEKRELITALRKSLVGATDGKGAAEALAGAETALLDVRSRTERGHESVVSGYRAAEWFQEKLKNPPSESRGIKAPFSFLGRWQPGRLYVLSGYTADGKTVCSVQFAKSACSDRAKVGFCTIEMSWQDLTDRVVSTYGVPYSDAMSGRVKPEHMQYAKEALLDLSSWNIDLIDDESLTAAKITTYQTLGHYDFLIIDHLHRFDWVDRRELERTITAITNIARRFGIPVLLLAQLHRSGDNFPCPTLTSVRETGMLENEAAMLAAIWRHRDENKLPTKDAEFLVLKNRFGRTGTWALNFNGGLQRYEEPFAVAA